MTDETPLTQEELDEMLMRELGLLTVEEIADYLQPDFSQSQAEAIAETHRPYINVIKKLAQKLDQST